MKQQIKRAKKNLQDALELISEDDIEKDLLHDYILDALKAVENLNLDDVSNCLITTIIKIDPEDSFIGTQLPIKLVDGHLSY